MKAPFLRTRLTDLLGIDLPILGGGLMWLSDARYVAALVNAGCMGFITPRSFACSDAFADALAQCKALTGGRPFGVNITLSTRHEANRDVKRWLDIALAEGVRLFETAGHAPVEVIEALHSAGALVIHKAPGLRYALAAERAGADAIVMVGMEEGGHPGANELPASLLGALAIDHLRVPVVIAGGIGHGRQIAAALAQGLDGVMMGSRFLVAEEIPAHRAYKEHLVGCDEHASLRVLHALSSTWRVLNNETARKVQAIEQAGAREFSAFGELIDGRIARDQCYVQGDWRHGMASLGPAIAFADQIEPVQAIIQRLVSQMHEALRRLSSVELMPPNEQAPP